MVGGEAAEERDAFHFAAAYYPDLWSNGSFDKSESTA